VRVLKVSDVYRLGRGFHLLGVAAAACRVGKLDGASSPRQRSYVGGTHTTEYGLLEKNDHLHHYGQFEDDRD